MSSSLTEGVQSGFLSSRRYVGAAASKIERGGKLIVKGGLDNEKEGVLVAHVECEGVKV